MVDVSNNTFNDSDLAEIHRFELDWGRSPELRAGIGLREAIEAIARHFIDVGLERAAVIAEYEESDPPALLKEDAPLIRYQIRKYIAAAIRALAAK